jgi:hypothetical protein
MRLRLTGLLIALAAAPVAAAAVDGVAQPPQPAVESPPIVVRGIRTETYRERLRRCLERRCPVNEDVDATLALAEALFLNGDYVEARAAVHASIGRNRRAAAGFPEPVADLFRAYTRVSRHLGYDDAAARAANDILRSLQAGLPREDYRHFTARLEIADLQMTMGNATRARRELAELIRAARAAGREDVATLAMLRTIWFDYIVDPYGDAKSRLIEMTRSSDPAQRLRTTGARVLLARMYRSEGDARRADALLVEVGRGNSAQRRLITSPPYSLLEQEVPNAMDLVTDSGGNATAVTNVVNLGSTIHRLPPNVRDKWIDVGFWVMPDGRVSGLELVRRSSEDPWHEPLIEAIRNRLYSTADEPSYRLERYTYTARLGEGSASRLQQHAPQARVEYMDLTANAPPAGNN